jgi:hypothetical protein
MKTSVIEETGHLEENIIQGLYPVKNSCQSFWFLLSKIELSVFKKQNGEVKP